MKILVINGDCLTTNSSANLCHLSYINGMLDAGYEVDLISAGTDDKKVDNSMSIPAGVNCYTYNATSLYEKGSHALKNNAPAQSTEKPANRKIGLKSKIIRGVKSAIRSCYGIYGIYKPFIKKAIRFKSSIEYDYVISIATPASSHYIAYKLIKKGNVKTKKWIQIWEDPWYGDIYGGYHTKKYLKAEKKLLKFADKICYVSPLTLENQKRYFPESADKMYWQPLPSYYRQEEDVPLNKALNYGYFGDYNPAARNLKPFYEAAKKAKIPVNICGTPHTLFESTENIHIYPRLTLDKLKPIEDKTEVLIFLCNRAGGQIPGKIYQYSATKKLILFILDGTNEEKQILKNYFSKFNRYIFCENTTDDIIQAINKISSNDYNDINITALRCFKPKDIIENILLGKNG